MDSFLVCGGFATGYLTLLSLEEDLGVLADAFFITVGSSKVADVSDDVAKKLKSRSVHAVGVTRARAEGC